MSKGLKAPYAWRRRPLSWLGLIAADGRQDVKATTGVRAAVDPEVLAVNRQCVRPATRQLALANELAAHIDPVRDELPLVRRRSTTPILIARRHPTPLSPSDLPPPPDT